MKKQLFTLALGVFGLGAFSQSPSTIWQSYNSNVAPNTYIQHLSVVDTNVVWGTDGNLYNMFTRTTDGANYHAGKFNPDTNTFNVAGISAVDANTAWIASFAKAGGQGQVIKTTNGGSTWTSVITAGMYSGSLAFPDWIHFWDANNGIVFGDPNGCVGGVKNTTNMFEIYRTHNGGTTWTRVDSTHMALPLSGDAGFTSSYAAYKHFLWAGTYNGLVYASADSGKTWTYPSATSIGLDGGVNGIAFRDSIHGLAWGPATAGGANATIGTSDGGVTWHPVHMGTMVGVNAISYIPKTKGFMSVGADSTLAANYATSVTYNDGATWTVLETSPVLAANNPKRMLSLQMVDSLNGWAGNFADTSNRYAHGKGGMNRFRLGHKPGCPIGITTASTSTPFNVCLGSSITMTASGLNTYTWSTSATTPSISATPTVNTTYSVAGTSTVSGGCANYETFNVTVVSSTITSTAYSHSVCPSATTALTVANASTYTWTPATFLSATTGASVVSTPTANITYTITGSKNNCPSAAPITIAMHIKATPTVSITSNTLALCSGSTATLTASGATTYQWSGGSTATTASVAVSPTVTTTYSVAGTSTISTCPGMSMVTVTVSTCAGIENYASSNNVSVYPNPSNGLVTISLTNLEANTIMYVTNMIGQEVIKTAVKDLNTNLDFSNLQKGIYTLTVTNGKDKSVSKLIIQ
jgi:hypothetical protein